MIRDLIKINKSYAGITIKCRILHLISTICTSAFLNKIFNVA